MNLLLLNAASGSKLEQALEKLVDFGMDAGKDILVAILIYSVGRFIIKQISVEKPLNFDPFGHAELSLLAKI